MCAWQADQPGGGGAKGVVLLASSPFQRPCQLRALCMCSFKSQVAPLSGSFKSWVARGRHSRTPGWYETLELLSVIINEMRDGIVSAPGAS